MDPSETIAFLRAVVPVARELGVTRVSVGPLAVELAVVDADIPRLQPAAPDSANQEPPPDDLTPPLYSTWGIVARKAAE